MQWITNLQARRHVGDLRRLSEVSVTFMNRSKIGATLQKIQIVVLNNHNAKCVKSIRVCDAISKMYRSENIDGFLNQLVRGLAPLPMPRDRLTILSADI